VDGYEWVQTEPLDETQVWTTHRRTADGRHLLLVPRSAKFEPVALIDQHHTLFRTVADLPRTPDAIREFANRYGAILNAVGYAPTDGAPPLPASTLTDWYTDITRLQNVTESWERGAYKAAAAAINDQLQRLQPTQPESRWFPRGPLVEFKMVLPGDGPPQLTPVPTSLLGLLWVQLISAVERNKQFRRCSAPRCSIWIDVSPDEGAKRRDSEFCSDACRSRAYRDRRRQARVLHSRRVSLRLIASQLDSDQATVKKWLR
jgi:hypothetical protein